MAKIEGTEFLAPKARMGLWWDPRDSDTNDAGELNPLPDRRKAGIMSASSEGHWQLLVSSVEPLDDNAVIRRFSDVAPRRESIWGRTRDGSVSLFDGWCVSPRSWLRTGHEETWVGNWWAESGGAWFVPQDIADRVEVEFDIAAAWSERGLGPCRDLDLMDAWDPVARRLDLPDVLERQTNIGDSAVKLRRECVSDCGTEAFSARIRTYFSIDGQTALNDVKDRWVRPLYELLSFCWAENARVVEVLARDAQDGRNVRLYYPEPLAPQPKPGSMDSGLTVSPFLCLGDLERLAIDFGTLLARYFDWIGRGHRSTLSLLIDSQGPLLDHSVGSRLLSATRSLEAFKKATDSGRGRVNLGSAIGELIAHSGPVGEDISRLWDLRGNKPLEKSVPEIRSRYAAHVGGVGNQRFATVDELLDLERHVAALQWLLRWQYLQALGICDGDAADLVTKSRGYKGMLRITEQRYGNSDVDSSQGP